MTPVTRSMLHATMTPRPPTLLTHRRAPCPWANRVRCAVKILLGISAALWAIPGVCDSPIARNAPAIGASAAAGCLDRPARVQRLSITKPGVYENILIDGEWIDSTLVKITSDNVILRHCEIRNGRHNAIAVYAKNVVIESCKIHHLLAGTFQEQRDAHGITGCPQGLTIRNCDIGLVSGDAVQFDPGRGPWDHVVIENCTLWTAPLTLDAAGFQKGQRPGENAVDTKQSETNARSRIIIRNCRMFGWRQPAAISNMAALNLKNHIEATVEQCVLHENEIAFRVRGGTGEYGGAHVAIDRCAVYDSLVAVRAEDKIHNLKIRRLGIAADGTLPFKEAGGGVGQDFHMESPFEPPPLEQALQSGLPE